MEPNNELWFIWSNEHKGWWRPARCGYTSYKSLAGKYTLEESLEIVKDANKYKGDDDQPNEAMIKA